VLLGPRELVTETGSQPQPVERGMSVPRPLAPHHRVGRLRGRSANASVAAARASSIRPSQRPELGLERPRDCSRLIAAADLRLLDQLVDIAFRGLDLGHRARNGVFADQR
jgi:hypothetical protein